jgi:hypothetical protein
MRSSNQRIVLFVVTFVILSIPAVYAGPVSIPQSGMVILNQTQNNIDYSYGAGGAFWANINTTPTPTVFLTFCVEINEEFSPGTQYYYTIDGNAIMGGGTSASGVPIAPGTALLYSEFMKNALPSSFNGSSFNGSSFNVSSTLDDGILQEAIWMLQGFNPWNYFGWDTSSSAYKSAVDLANWAAANAKGNAQSYGVYALNLWTGGDYNYGGLVQSQLVYVPEPSLIFLLGIGIGAATLIGFRFKA